MTTKQEYQEHLSELKDAQKRLAQMIREAKKLNPTLHYELLKASQSVETSKSIWIRSGGFSFGGPQE